MGEIYRREETPFPLYTIDLLEVSDDELLEASRELGLALNLEEMKSIQDYFRRAGRRPTDVELQSLGQAWSEHCCYKSSKYFLREFIFGIESPQVLLKGDAGVVEFDEDHALALRIESHNHPSAVEPYGGAATGIGGILRDVLCMGAKPVALVDPLHFGPLDYAHEKLPKDVKHPLYLFQGVVAGIRDYGNRVGVPTVAGSIYFDDGYVNNIIVNVGCVGIARKDRILRNAVQGPHDVFILAGGRTGRDGIHGVTFASLELTDEMWEEWRAGAVQLGDPIMKEPLMHACLEASERGLLDGMKDLGGGGLSCVVGEMALAGGYGAEVQLDRVPLKEEELSPWEIWVSESQERMMLAVSQDRVDEVLEIFELFDVPATPIGRVIEERVSRVFYRGHRVLEMDLEFYTRGPEYCRPFTTDLHMEGPKEVVPSEPEDYGKVTLDLLSSPNIASKELVIRQYDHEVRASTVVKPMQGILGKECHGDATVLKPLTTSWRGLAIATASTPQYARLHPFRGGASAVDEVCRNLVSVGARPLALSDCLNFGNPEKPDRLGYFRDAVRGLGYVASTLGLPIPSGNVSFYNETPASSVPPTPVVLGTGIVPDIRRCITSDLKAEGSNIYLLGRTKAEMGGSEYYGMMGGEGGEVPDVDAPRLKASVEGLLRAMESGLVRSCHDLSHGGLAVALAEMCMGGDMGAEVRLDSGSLRPDIFLFAESNTRWLLEVVRGGEGRVERTLQGLPLTRIGEVVGSDLAVRISGSSLVLALEEMREVWSSALPRLVIG
ncbi:MAG: phosphoribosylformylglycinamidine synthase subunit PurL [Thermoplasmata archaeon]